MDIRLVNLPRPGDGGLADHARRRLSSRLMHRSDRIAHVRVELGDAGNHRGRRDAYCVMQVQLRGAPPLTVVDIGADARRTVDRAVDRVGRLSEERLRLADARRRTAIAADAKAR